MGPGRKIYHKPCLTCTECNKRLDSLQLVEHDREPYCKPCHLRLFGTRDLRHNNLPVNAPPTAPKPTLPPVPSTPPRLPARREESVAAADSTSTTSSFSHLTRSNGFSPVRPLAALSSVSDNGTTTENGRRPAGPRALLIPSNTGQPSSPTKVLQPTLTGQVTFSSRPLSPPASAGGAERNGSGTASPTRPGFSQTISPPSSPRRPPVSPTTSSWPLPPSAKPAVPTSTGKSSAVKFGGSRVECARCGKAVFFAEQVVAVGKKWHKSCLRCAACSTSLDSSKLTERDGTPYCKSCYAKNFGPTGVGYALLGRVG